MLKFVEKVFRVFFEVFLWLFLIECVVGGGIVGYFTSRGRGLHTFLGITIGLFVGLILNILGGGLVATFLNINVNLEKLVNENLSSENNNNIIENRSIITNKITENKPIATNKLLRKCAICKQKVSEGDASCPYCGNRTFE